MNTDTRDTPTSRYSGKTKNNRPRRRPSNVVPFSELLRRMRMRSSSRGARARGVHGQEVVAAKIHAFTSNRSDHSRPVLNSDTLALPPLADLPMTDANVSGHLGQRIPQSEELFERPHPPLMPRDKLSRQRGTTHPVTGPWLAGKNPVMGKATTPTMFKRDFCARLKAARIMAGYEQAEFAKALGLLPNTYNKYETRSLLPRYLIPKACELLKIDPADLFLGRGAQRKAG